MKNIVLLIAAFMLAITSFSQINKHEYKLQQLYQQKNYDGIIKYRGKKTKDFSSQALYYKGMGYFNKKDNENALKYFDLAIKKKPVFVDMYFNKCLTLLYMEEYDLSIECVDIATGIYSENRFLLYC